LIEIISSKIPNAPFAATKVFLGENNERTADILGTSAVIISDLKQRRKRSYEFDWNRALQVKCCNTAIATNTFSQISLFSIPLNQ
jgi:arginyl-tRNA synthetase